jgi:hypothetical protein
MPPLLPNRGGLGGAALDRDWVDAHLAFRVEHAYRGVSTACEQER